jgi:hypothetical protein
MPSEFHAAGYTTKASDPKLATWHDNDPQDADETWKLKAPNLTKNSPWHKECFKSILQAIEGEPKAE